MIYIFLRVILVIQTSMLPVGGKLWTKAGSELGGEKGYAFLIVRAIYGLESSGEAWRSKLAETLNSMSYRYTYSDPNIWINRTTTDNVTEY